MGEDSIYFFHWQRAESSPVINPTNQYLLNRNLGHICVNWLGCNKAAWEDSEIQ